MWVEALVFVETPGATAPQRRSFDAAMGRRGWEPAKTDSFRSGFTDVESEERIVKLIEQDVRESAYVAGIADFEAACLLSDGSFAASFAEHLDLNAMDGLLPDSED
jgi:hypothetical protein